MPLLATYWFLHYYMYGFLGLRPGGSTNHPWACRFLDPPTLIKAPSLKKKRHWSRATRYHVLESDWTMVEAVYKSPLVEGWPIASMVIRCTVKSMIQQWRIEGGSIMNSPYQQKSLSSLTKTHAKRRSLLQIMDFLDKPLKASALRVEQWSRLLTTPTLLGIAGPHLNFWIRPWIRRFNWKRHCCSCYCLHSFSHFWRCWAVTWYLDPL